MQDYFPKLNSNTFRITSPQTIEYNCIAWAAEDTEAWWWPDTFEQYYWPTEIKREENLESFVKAFETLGYIYCEDAEYEPGYTKIALYAKQNGRPTHAARQINENKWTSKIGQLEDIEHEIGSLSGDIYGEPVVYMKRPLK